jgi:hypothetical protein
VYLIDPVRNQDERLTAARWVDREQQKAILKGIEGDSESKKKGIGVKSAKKSVQKNTNQGLFSE